MRRTLAQPSAIALAILIACVLSLSAATISTRSAKKSVKVTDAASARKTVSHKRRTRRARRSAYQWINGHLVRRNRYYERFVASSFTEGDQTSGDVTAGEDPIVRQAAIDALGNMAGTVVAIDPNSGRILAMVNQKLALSEGAEPCSTIKISVALAALSEGIITKDTRVALGRRSRMDLTKALAHSNNAYFEALGRQLGFDTVYFYAHQFGLGELAGYNIPGEHLGEYPDTPLDAKLGGVGKMCSFGESISMTPLQLGALVSAIANGGTLYYLQHPTSTEDLINFRPRVKRYLDIAPLIPEIAPGMAGAVQYGTAQSVRWNFSQEEVLGKTGTCSSNGTRFGWFGSYANTAYGKIVVVVFLEGGRPTFGPKAAEIAGKMYRDLYEKSYFAAKTPVSDRTAAAGASQ